MHQAGDRRVRMPPPFRTGFRRKDRESPRAFRYDPRDRQGAEEPAAAAVPLKYRGAIERWCDDQGEKRKKATAPARRLGFAVRNRFRRRGGSPGRGRWSGWRWRRESGCGGWPVRWRASTCWSTWPKSRFGGWVGGGSRRPTTDDQRRTNKERRTRSLSIVSFSPAGVRSVRVRAVGGWRR